MARVGVLNYLNDGKVEGLGRRGCMCVTEREREESLERNKGRLSALHGILVVLEQNNTKNYIFYNLIATN